MKTTSEQLLARAEELEARARALRIAAAEMNGHQTAEKQTKVAELFQAATKIRKAVKVWEVPEPEAPELPSLPKKQRYKPSDLAPYLARMLDGTTRTTVEIQRLLKDQGVKLGGAAVRDHLAKLPQVTRVSGGRGTDVRWQLKGQTPWSAKRSSRRTRPKWSPAQHKKFVATMKRKAAEKRLERLETEA